MKIHPVISVTQLKPASKDDDPYKRIVNDHPPPVVETGVEDYGDSFEIERLIANCQVFYSWKGSVFDKMERLRPRT